MSDKSLEVRTFRTAFLSRRLEVDGQWATEWYFVHSGGVKESRCPRSVSSGPEDFRKEASIPMAEIPQPSSHIHGQNGVKMNVLPRPGRVRIKVVRGKALFHPTQGNV